VWQALFHILSSFPYRLPDGDSVGFLSIRLEEVSEFVNLGLCLDSGLTMKAAVREIKARATKAHVLVMVVSYSLHYDNSIYNTAHGCPPSRILTLWKASVLPHLLLHLRYIPDDALVAKLQVALTRSLETCLHVYGEKTAILVEMGIPPIHYTQHAQLAQFRDWLSSRTSNVIPHVLWSKSASNTVRLPPASLDRWMRASTLYLDPGRVQADCAMPPSVANAKPPNRDTSEVYMDC
jgi:hypothetical protein